MEEKQSEPRLRQDVILEMYESGKPTKIIGRELGLSPNTIMQQIVMARRRRLITQLEARAEAAEAKVKMLEAAILSAEKISQIVSFMRSDEAFREAYGPDPSDKAPAALVYIEGDQK